MFIRDLGGWGYFVKGGECSPELLSVLLFTFSKDLPYSGSLPIWLPCIGVVNAGSFSLSFTPNTRDNSFFYNPNVDHPLLKYMNILVSFPQRHPTATLPTNA